MGLGTATPALRMPQDELAARLARLWGLRGPELERWRRIVQGSAIDVRHGVLPVEAVLPLSTRARMEAYERHAPPLAERAASSAMSRAGIDASRVTDLVVVSCTGFAAPGLDVALIERLGLRPTVRRTIVGFMGCFGAICGLRVAVGACRAEPRAVALVLCLELCSLHVRADLDPQNLVASALFADGAAAAVVCGARAPEAGPGHGRPALGSLSLGRSRLLPEGRDWMSWRITDAGFAMTLSRDVPVALARAIGPVVDELSPATRPRCYAVHPGGAAILDGVDEGLGLRGGSGIEVARAVLRRCGNMSSATVLFVLAEALAAGYRPPALMLAFGPGLAIEGLLVGAP